MIWTLVLKDARRFSQYGVEKGEAQAVPGEHSSMQLNKASKPGPICHYLLAQWPGRGDDSVHSLTVGELWRWWGEHGTTVPYGYGMGPVRQRCEQAIAGASR